MDKPLSKKIGVPRFDGRGKMQARPGTVKWYRQNIPQRFESVRQNIESAGYDYAASEVIAARVLKWSESAQPHINESLLKEEKRLDDREASKQADLERKLGV